MNARTRKIGGNFVLTLISILLCMLAIEAIFRVLTNFNIVGYPRPNFEKIIHQYAEEEGLVYELIPMVSKHGIQTNRYGLRDYSYPLEKPANTLRICVIGDSVTFGHRLSVKDTYPKILERMLNSNYKDEMRFEVINFAVVGYNSYQEEIVLKKKCLPFNPDIVLVGFCLNDDTYTDGLGELAREMSPYSLGGRLNSELLSYLLYRYERANFESWNDIGKVEQFFETLSRVKTRENIEVILMVFPYYFENLDSYGEIEKHKQVNDIAKRLNLPVIDFLDSWNQLEWETRIGFYIYNDRIHLSKKGMEDVASRVYEYLQRKLSPING